MSSRRNSVPSPIDRFVVLKRVKTNGRPVFCFEVYGCWKDRASAEQCMHSKIMENARIMTVKPLDFCEGGSKESPVARSTQLYVMVLDGCEEGLEVIGFFEQPEYAQNWAQNLLRRRPSLGTFIGPLQLADPGEMP